MSKQYNEKETILTKLRELSSTLLADSMNYENVMDYHIKPVNYKEPLVGQVRTVSVYPGDNLYLHYAIYESNPGDILVVDCKGSTYSACLGNLMAAAAEKMGIKGIIVDGLVRDKQDLSDMDIQIYSKGFVPTGPRKNGPGTFDDTISCGGIQVHSGDFVIGDEDGVVIIPHEKIEESIISAEKKLAYENKRLQKIMEFNLNEQHNDTSALEPAWLRDAIKNNSQ
ncbi:RraA family protein [Oceanobacillus oncorhynchi]|uniref:RraA family protein n=1 Tax=Oceanobacillus oncorhynchi TaxID=545501 RepID=UPI0034D4F866